MLADLTHAIHELDEAAEAYDRALRYFEGDTRELFASPRVRSAIAKSGLWGRFNLAKTAVTALANRVAISGVSVPGDDRATEEISRLRILNKLEIEEPNIHRKTFIYGDGYLFCWPIFDDGPTPTGVRMIWNGPECARMIYDEDDPAIALYLVKSWYEGGGDIRTRRADLYYPNGSVERYTRENTAGATWAPYLDADQGQWLITHPYGLPFFHFRNGTPYGRPEHADAFSAQDAINKLLTTHLSTVEYQAFSQWWALTRADSVLDQNNDDPDWDDDADDTSGSDSRGGVSSGMRADPGTIMHLTGVEEVGQFDPADPDVFIKPVDLYVRLMSQVTGTPLYDFDPSREQPSGIARKRAEAPLIDKANNRATQLGATWADVWRHCLAIMGYRVDAVDVRFRPMFTIDDKEGWEVLAAKVAAGVPRRQALMEAGYTTAQLDEWGITNDQSAPPAVA